MKVTLSHEDIENIIKEKFDGVNSVKFSPTGEAELDVDYSNFKEKTPNSKYEHKHIPDTVIPTKEKTAEEVKQGVMVSGGIHRPIQHMG